MDELLEGVIHSQKGELEMRKAEFGDLQVDMGVGGAELQDCCTAVVGTPAFRRQVARVAGGVAFVLERWAAGCSDISVCLREPP